MTHFITDHLYSFLFLTGLISGLVDAIAGGGGLISLPILMSIGMPPHIALGTNKLQTTIGTSVATYSFYTKKLFSLRTVYKGLLYGLVGASLGAITTQIISSDILNTIIPFLLLFILGYTLLSPAMGQSQTPAKITEPLCFAVFGFLLGFYDGFFGPGTGSLWVFVLTFFLGYNFINATAYAKVFNLKSNIFATVLFITGGAINYHIAFCMALGQIIGGRIGAKLAIWRGASLIRPVFLTMVSATILSLVYKNLSSVVKLLWMTVADEKMMILMGIISPSILIFIYLKRKHISTQG